MRPLTEQEHALLERFHRTPVASVLGNRPPQWEPWEAVQARYRERYAAEQEGTPLRNANRLRLIAEAARRARRG